MQARRADPAPGEVLAGRFRVERVIGQGGMGIVVAAFDPRTKERVALKLMHPHEERNPVAVERFFREARAASRITSPYVTRVVEVARLEDGRPFMAMELLEGADLGRVLKDRGTLGVGEAALYVQQAASGCAVAHAAGVVHRDLKPANLFLARGSGGVGIKLLDFGISKLSGLSGTVGHQLTAEGDLTGSPLYMPPEQLRAREVDGRADVWALGVTLHELLTGRRPFQAENMMAECNRILTEAPEPPSRLRPDVPPGLNAVVLRCLEKNASARFASAADLAAALAPFVPRAPAGAKRGSGAGFAFALLLMAAMAAAGFYALRARGLGDAPSTAAPASTAAADGSR